MAWSIGDCCCYPPGTCTTCPALFVEGPSPLYVTFNEWHCDCLCNGGGSVTVPLTWIPDFKLWLYTDNCCPWHPFIPNLSLGGFEIYMGCGDYVGGHTMTMVVCWQNEYSDGGIIRYFPTCYQSSILVDGVINTCEPCLTFPNFFTVPPGDFFQCCDGPIFTGVTASVSRSPGGCGSSSSSVASCTSTSTASGPYNGWYCAYPAGRCSYWDKTFGPPAFGAGPYASQALCEAGGCAPNPDCPGSSSSGTSSVTPTSSSSSSGPAWWCSGDECLFTDTPPPGASGPFPNSDLCLTTCFPFFAWWCNDSGNCEFTDSPQPGNAGPFPNQQACLDGGCGSSSSSVTSSSTSSTTSSATSSATSSTTPTSSSGTASSGTSTASSATATATVSSEQQQGFAAFGAYYRIETPDGPNSVFFFQPPDSSVTVLAGPFKDYESSL